MDEKTSGIVTYLTLIGWVVVLATRKDKTQYGSFHLRQMAGLMALSFGIWFIGIIIGYVSGFLGMMWSFMSFIPLVLWILAFIGALNGEEKLTPVLGEKFQEWFKPYF